MVELKVELKAEKKDVLTVESLDGKRVDQSA
jgi:hypothetical protein